MIRSAAVAALVLAATPIAAAERTFPVTAFDRVAVEGSPEVTVTTGHNENVRVSGDPAAIDRLDIRVENNVLKIGRKHDALSWTWSDHGRVRIAVAAPMVRGVDVAGSSAVTVDRVKGREFAANIAGSGSLTVAALDADRTSFDVSGSGTVAAAGRCNIGSAKIAGSGEMKLAGLRCATLSASIAGSGSIAAFASQTATLATMGSGDITLTGGARCTVSTAGSGRAKCS